MTLRFEGPEVIDSCAMPGPGRSKGMFAIVAQW